MRGEADWVTGKLPPRLCWNLRDRGDVGGLLELSTCSTQRSLSQCLGPEAVLGAAVYIQITVHA